MRATSVCVVLTTVALCLASAAIPGQRGAPQKKAVPAKDELVHVSHDIRNLLRTPFDSRRRWLETLVGETGSISICEGGSLLVKASRAAQTRVVEFLQWSEAILLVRFEVEITELRGEPKKLDQLQESAGRVLKDRDAVSKLLRLAKKQGGFTLKNHPPRKLQDRGLVPLSDAIPTDKPKPAKKSTPAKKGEADDVLRVGVTLLRDGGFLAKTWHPRVPLTELHKGQTLVVRDPHHRRMLLIRFDKLTAKRRPAPVGR